RFNVFVRGGRFLVEEVALFANDAAAQRGLDQFRVAEAFAHAGTTFAAGPLAAGAGRQRPEGGHAVAERWHKIAERGAASGNHHRAVVGRHGAFAMQPQRFASRLPDDAVMATIPDALGFAAERAYEPLGNELAVRFGPTDGEVMASEIFR